MLIKSINTPLLRYGFGLPLVLLFAALVAGCGNAPSDDASIELKTESPATAPLAAEDRDPNRLWCNEHGVYEDECYICHPELAPDAAATPAANTAPEERDPKRLWCNEHSVYEDECYICHPELAPAEPQAKRDPNRLWCNEHSVYEDECYICHPELAGTVLANTAPPETGGLYCKEHDLYELECGICHPELLVNLGPGEGLKVRLPSLAAAGKAGIRMGTAQSGDSLARTEVLGEVTFNKNQLAVSSPTLDGILREVKVDAGTEVEAGELLATLASPELSRESNAYLKALAGLEYSRGVYTREQDLLRKEISARQEVEAAKSAHDASNIDVKLARQRLMDLGLSEEEIKAMADADSGKSLLPLRAPFKGTVVERNAVMGEAAAAGTPLFRIADLSSMWVEMAVTQGVVSKLRQGQDVSVTFDVYPGREFQGRITWISPMVDPVTRMVMARAELPNPDGLLRNGMFGKVRADAASTGQTSLVPKDAVQYVDGMPVVFAKLAEDLYETRIVQLDHKHGDVIAISAGLAAGENIALGQTHILKSELLKARLGAGCVHD